MRSLLPLILYCISLVSLQLLLTLALEERPDKNRVDLLNKLFELREDKAPDSGGQLEIAVRSSTSSQSLTWLTGFLRHPKALRLGRALPALARARPTEASLTKQRELRVRRHAQLGSRGGHHYQLMRVGCVLGTCQVQNLSHRLYQLIGQSGREDSSPINPKSPHSYG